MPKVFWREIVLSSGLREDVKKTDMSSVCPACAERLSDSGEPCAMEIAGNPAVFLQGQMGFVTRLQPKRGMLQQENGSANARGEFLRTLNAKVVSAS